MGCFSDFWTNAAKYVLASIHGLGIKFETVKFAISEHIVIVSLNILELN